MNDTHAARDTNDPGDASRVSALSAVSDANSTNSAIGAHGSPGSGHATALPTPPLLRRLVCFVYEGVLLFGVVMAAGLVYSVSTQQHHALVGVHGMQASLFVVLGLYFIWFWSRSGQTLAMQTWHIRLVTRSGAPVSPWRALARYLLAWLWFLPALVAVYFSGLKGPAPVFTAMFVGALAYAALSRLHPDRQYWHDAVCGTRLVSWRVLKKA